MHSDQSNRNKKLFSYKLGLKKKKSILINIGNSDSFKHNVTLFI